MAEVGFEPPTYVLQVQSSTIWAIQPYHGVDPFLTNLVAMGAHTNLECLVTEDHT